jgi:hypothetical protein
VDEWLNWATAPGCGPIGTVTAEGERGDGYDAAQPRVLPVITDFIAAQRSALFAVSKATTAGSIEPSPRSWDRLSQTLRHAKVMDPKNPAFFSLAAGFVGADLATAFQSHANKLADRLTAEDVYLRGRQPEVLARIQTATPEKKTLLVEQIVQWAESLPGCAPDTDPDKVALTPDQAENIAAFYAELDPEARIGFHTKMMRLAQKSQDSEQQLAKIVSFHRATVRLFLEVFGVEPGEKGSKMEPKIPAFLQNN